MAIGQIDLIGESGEVAKSWRIRKPRCTIGSSPDCNVQLTSSDIAPLHATLVFGKKHTLLRSVGPTLISKRHVREWLIDESTEIIIGQSRLVVHPSNCILANVVHAENLIDQASRLSKDPKPVNAPIAPQAIAKQTPEQAPLVPATKNESLDAIAATRLDTIEKLLESLKQSLDKMQASIGLEAKSSSESIVQSVSMEIDEFGKRLFTDLNKQITNQTGVQESLISGFADQFSDRFGAIDDQLNRFYESSTIQTSTLNELLAQAAEDQKLIETRFQEVSAHRNELMDAVQILRTEILLANDLGSHSSFQSQGNENPPSTDPGFTQNQVLDVQPSSFYTEHRESSPANTDYEYHQSNPAYQSAPQGSGPSVTDEQLAHSLELAQIQIQELNQQLRNLEIERDAAENRVASLSESWQIQQEQFSQPFESNVYPEATPADDLALQASEEVNYDTPSYRPHEEVSSTDFVENAYDEATYTAPSEERQTEADRFEEPPIQNRELPSWFKQDEPQKPSYQAESYSTEQQYTPSPESNFSFSTPDLSSYSDADYPVETSSETSLSYRENSLTEQTSTEEEQVDSHLGDYSSNLDNLDSISDRLQRMLADADQRRSPANPNSKPRTSQNWAQKFNTQPAAESLEEASNNGGHQSEFVGSERSNPIDRVAGSSFEQTTDQPANEEYASFSQQRTSSIPESISGRNDELTQDAYLDEPIDQDYRRSETPASTFSNAKHDSRPDQDSVSGKDSEEEESIEAYMQRLLNRVRGEAEKSPTATQTKTPIAEVPVPAVQPNPTKPRSRVAASMGLEMEDALPPPSERLSEELFVPRQQAPEQRNDLAALRELANTNARRAITRSDIRRTNSAFFLKLGVTALAVFSAVALFLFNGFTLNAPFAGMVAAIVVALLWGFDCVNHFRRLKNVGLNQATPAETAAGQSIRVGNSDDESGWRPTPA